MIDWILPDHVASASALDDPADIRLFPQEEAALGEAVDKRRREYTTVRACARRALAQLGLPAVPVVPGPRGAPVWPDGVVGSMTHCAGYRAAAVARATDIAAIGIDVEPHDVLPEGVLEAVALTEELRWIAEAGSKTGVCWDRLLFSAKEAVFKVWYPLMKQELDFDEASITFHTTDGVPGAGSGLFTARLLVPGPVVGGRRLTEFSGRWMARDGLACTAVTLPAPP